MPFQRSYTKVWWGSDNQLPLTGGSQFGRFQQHVDVPKTATASQQQMHSGYHSLDFNNFKTYNGNLSRIQEVEDEHNNSRISTASSVWGEKHDSPGSLRSQDSGFSDNDESHSSRSTGGCSSKTASPNFNKSIRNAEITTTSTTSINNNDPSSPSQVTDHDDDDGERKNSSIPTPPTVIRRTKKSEFFAPLVSVSRRISFTGSPANKAAVYEQRNNNDDGSGGGGVGEVDSSSDTETNISIENLQQLDDTNKQQQQQQKRRRRVSRRPTKPLTPTKRRTLVDYGLNDSENDHEKNDNNDVPEYHNETVFLGNPNYSQPPTPYNNETVILGGLEDDESSLLLSPLRDDEGNYYAASTSTPKRISQFPNDSSQCCSMSTQSWLNELRCFGGEPEVMSTLQTKSIVQEAFKNLTITTNTVTKLIRQLQQRSLYMQSDFERIERLLQNDGETPETVKLHQALSGADQLLSNATEFTRVLERRAVFFADERNDRRRYDHVLDQIRCITKDTRYSLERHHYISLESLLDDVQLLKRQLLIAIRQLFERMVGVVVRSIESTGARSDLMLRANINMLVTLSNIDYEGFASLSDAFVQCEAVRALLIVCLDHRQSSVRALALRGLATICCVPEAIGQLGSCGGIEIIRDTLQAPVAIGDGTLTRRSKAIAAAVNRGPAERREAVSLLTQITAAWHGPAHRVAGLKDCLEPIVEGLTHLLTHTDCPQTLLLCAAALNNLGRLEITSHYSIMSNEAIFRLIDASERKSESEVSIFFYEQVVAMLHNMSLNKKCHSHLANSAVINFITATYQTQFYYTYDSRAESEAQRRTIKAILHTLTRLVHDSNLGVDLLEQQRSMPSFLRLVTASIGNSIGGGGRPAGNFNAADQSQLESREISLLTRELLWAQKEDAQPQADYSVSQADNENEDQLEANTDMGEQQQEEAAIDCGGIVEKKQVMPSPSPLPVNVTATTITTATGQTYNLSRQESYV